MGLDRAQGVPLTLARIAANEKAARRSVRLFFPPCVSRVRQASQ
jgi:hypothetical protein